MLSELPDAFPGMFGYEAGCFPNFGSRRSLLGHAIALSASAADIGDARPLFESHCFDCHGNGASEGNLSLDALLAADDSPAVRSQWRKVWKMVRQGFMPPADAEPLARDDRKAITQWIEQAHSASITTIPIRVASRCGGSTAWSTSSR